MGASLSPSHFVCETDEASLGFRYKADQATWAANEHLGDCAKIIEDFQQAADIEGRDLRARDATILLNEAAAAGWARLV